MTTDRCAKGRRVRVTSYSPFRGLKGTIRCVHTIDDEGSDPFCFYLIALDALREPIWFEHREVEFLDMLPVPVKACQDPANRGTQDGLQKDHTDLDLLSSVQCTAQSL